MTLINIESKKCANCNQIIQVFKESSCSVHGFGDMDFRPNCSLRGILLDNQIEACPHCGYISTDIGYKSKEYETFCKSELYNSFYNTDFNGINKTALRFIKYAIYKDWIENYAIAYEYMLKAAWKFDDLEDDNNACHCRKKTIEILNRIEEKTNRQILELADLYRRTGGFKEVELLLNNRFFEDEWERKMSKYQLYLSSKKDISRHCIEEALWHIENI